MYFIGNIECLYFVPWGHRWYLGVGWRVWGPCAAHWQSECIWVLSGSGRGSNTRGHYSVSASSGVCTYLSPLNIVLCSWQHPSRKIIAVFLFVCFFFFNKTKNGTSCKRHCKTLIILPVLIHCLSKNCDTPFRWIIHRCKDKFSKWCHIQAWDEDSPLVLEDEDEDFQNCEAKDEDKDSVL